MGIGIEMSEEKPKPSDEIIDIVKGLRPCEKTNAELHAEPEYLKCPYCESKNVETKYASRLSGKYLYHYECLDCHKEFELE